MGDPSSLDDTDRLERERAFHNERFGEGTRTAQDKYYSALQGCFDQYEARRATLSVGARVLECGCATGDNGFALAHDAQSFSGIDISDVAIDEATAEAARRGLANTSFQVMDAHAMAFDADSFDFAFGSGILHHLDVPRMAAELSRVVRPGGRVLFVEPLGHNPLFNMYRQVTPNARTEDEHPLLKKDIDLLSEVFGEVKCDFFGLSSLAVVPFHTTPLRGPIYQATSRLDRALFAVPGAQWWAWYVLIEGVVRGPSDSA